MDATTGAVTPIITVASGLSFVEANASAFGSNHYFLYVKNEMYLDQLYSIDVSSNPVSMTPIGSPLSNAVHGLHFDANSGKLYGYTVDSSQQLVSVDATTGAVTPIITVASGLSFVEANASAFGSNHYFLYVKNEMYLDQLYSIDVSSNPVSMTPIGSPLSNAVHGTEFNCDTDGDGLCDDWETNGVTVNVNGTPVFVDLPAMGADPRHKDTFVHADYMVDAGLCVPLIGCFFGHTHKPKADAIQIVTRAFANAPVQNPDGSSGITLHVDCGPDCVMNPITGQTWGAMSQANGLNHQNALGFTVGGNYDG